MVSIRSFLVLVGVTVLLPIPAAAGGGWWNGIDLDSTHLALGETFTFRQQVAFADSVAAEQARHKDYGAYLMRELDQRMLDRAMSKPNPQRWWTPPDELVRVGDVEALGSDSNFFWAKVRLSVPEMPLGSYYLMLCDSGCREPLADIVPTRVRLSNEALAVQTARRLAQAEQQTDMKILRLDRLARRSLARVAELEQELAQSNAENGVLRSRLAAPNDRPQAAWWPYAISVAGGVVIGLLTLLVVRAWWRRNVDAAPVHKARWEPVDEVPDDARALTERSKERVPLS